MTDPFDLDAVRAARREALGEPPMFLFGGQKFVCPAEMPAEVLYHLDDSKAVMRCLLSDDFDDFWSHGPSKADLNDLWVWLRGRYGLKPGESAASDTSSAPSGTVSRPTSPATTSVTSATPVSAPGPSRSEPEDSAS